MTDPSPEMNKSNLEIYIVAHRRAINERRVTLLALLFSVFVDHNEFYEHPIGNDVFQMDSNEARDFMSFINEEHLPVVLLVNISVCNLTDVHCIDVYNVTKALRNCFCLKYEFSSISSNH